MSNIEQTLSIIKPDAVERNLIEEIKNIFLTNNLNIKESKKIHITKDEASEFYKVHQSKPFYNDLCAYLSSGPIVVMVLEGENAVSANRKLMGSTNPKDAEENTIRKIYGIFLKMIIIRCFYIIIKVFWVYHYIFKNCYFFLTRSFV